MGEVKKLAEASFDTLNTDKDEVLNEKDLASALGALESIDPKTGKAGTLDGKFEGLSINDYAIDPQQKNAFKELAQNVRKFLFKEE